MIEQLDDIRSLKSDLLAVSFSPPGRVAAYLNKYPLPISVVSDPELIGYRGFQLTRTSWQSFLRPTVIAGYLQNMWHGVVPTKPDPTDDLLQLGGDFVIDRNLRVLFSHPSSDATDRATPAEIIQALRSR